MAVDGHRLFREELDVVLQDEYGLASVAAEVEFFVDGVGVVRLPLTAGIFSIPSFRRVHIRLAQVVEQSHNDRRLLGHFDFRIRG